MKKPKYHIAISLVERDANNEHKAPVTHAARMVYRGMHFETVQQQYNALCALAQREGFTIDSISHNDLMWLFRAW